MKLPTLKAPYPYFGGKSAVMSHVWRRFGRVSNFVDPFCGSVASILGAPLLPAVVTLNDLDGFVCNFWRAVQHDPDAVARFVDWPVNEIDLFSRHVWLLKQGDLRSKLEADPDWFDAKIAGWWCWGACCWIGTGWCSGNGPHWIDEDGRRVSRPQGAGVSLQLPHLGNAGQGVNRKLPELYGERGVLRTAQHLQTYMADLSSRLRTARVACGDWARVLTPSVTTRHGLTAVLLDPPYGEGSQEYNAGGNSDKSISANVWAWAVANGGDPLFRLAVCGYEDGRAVPNGWEVFRYTARKGYQQDTASAVNRFRECIWFSPHCLQHERHEQHVLFEEAAL